MKHLKIIALLTFLVFLFNISYGQNTKTFTDKRDGKNYKAIEIGNQTWMAENLAFKAKQGCWAYEDSNENLQKYGYLYTWEVSKNVCPAGWHLPSDDEWKSLEKALGMSDEEANEDNYRGDGIGLKLKSTKSWRLYAGQSFGDNTSGFNALPAGYRTDYDETFKLIGDYCNWWSSTEAKTKYAIGRSLLYKHGKICRFTDSKDYGCSVRCVKDSK